MDLGRVWSFSSLKWWIGDYLHQIVIHYQSNILLVYLSERIADAGLVTKSDTYISITTWQFRKYVYTSQHTVLTSYHTHVSVIPYSPLSLSLSPFQAIFG
jgi:hypothetical protein